MNRIDHRLAMLKGQSRKALVTYIMAGDPDVALTNRLVLAMAEAGADMIELGVPYGDPLADGPVIQAAAARALAAGTTITEVLQVVKSVRKVSEVPLILLVYYNSVFKFGIKLFCTRAATAGIDGLIIPDLPLEERAEIDEIAKAAGLHLIPLVAPNSRERLSKITAGVAGFVYCVSSMGVTGQRQQLQTDIKSYLAEVRACTELPCLLGFGIRDAAMVQELKDTSGGLIVGSAIISEIAKGGEAKIIEQRVAKLVRQMRSALDQ